MKENNNLVDIKTISVDSSLSKSERITEFVRQIKDPHHFKCGDFTVTVKFPEDGPSLENCLQRIIAI